MGAPQPNLPRKTGWELNPELGDTPSPRGRTPIKSGAVAPPLNSPNPETYCEWTPEGASAPHSGRVWSPKKARGRKGPHANVAPVAFRAASGQITVGSIRWSLLVLVLIRPKASSNLLVSSLITAAALAALVK